MSDITIKQILIAERLVNGLIQDRDGALYKLQNAKQKDIRLELDFSIVERKLKIAKQELDELCGDYVNQEGGIVPCMY